MLRSPSTWRWPTCTPGPSPGKPRRPPVLRLGRRIRHISHRRASPTSGRGSCGGTGSRRQPRLRSRTRGRARRLSSAASHRVDGRAGSGDGHARPGSPSTPGWATSTTALGFEMTLSGGDAEARTVLPRDRSVRRVASSRLTSTSRPRRPAASEPGGDGSAGAPVSGAVELARARTAARDGVGRHLAAACACTGLPSACCTTAGAGQASRRGDGQLRRGRSCREIAVVRPRRGGLAAAAAMSLAAISSAGGRAAAGSRRPGRSRRACLEQLIAGGAAVRRSWSRATGAAAGDRPSAAFAAADLRQLAVPPRAAVAPRGSGHGVGDRAVGAGLPRHRPGDRRAGVRRGTGLRDPGGVHGRMGAGRLLAGGFRFVAQMLAYAMPLTMAVTAVATPAESLRPTAIVDVQHGGPDARLATTGVRAVLAVGHGGRVHRAVRPAAARAASSVAASSPLHGRAGGLYRPRAEGVVLAAAGGDGRALGRLASGCCCPRRCRWRSKRLQVAALGCFRQRRRLLRFEVELLLSFAWKAAIPAAIGAIVWAGLARLLR